jgi:hypothetical protein
LCAGFVTAPAALATPPVGFEVVPSPALLAGSALNAITTEGDQHAWAVGQQPTTGGNNTPVVEHWDGHAWRLVDLPTLPPINGHAVQDAGLTSITVADGEVWAAGWQRANGGSRPLVLNRHDQSWTVLPLPDGLAPTPSYRLTSIAALDAHHVWVAGYTIFHHASMFLQSWDGTKWTRYDLPLPPDTNYGQLLSAIALSAHNAWVTGNGYNRPGPRIPSKAATYHWDGKTWSLVPMPPVPGAPHEVLRTGTTLAAANGHDIWLAGDTNGSSSTTERWNSKAWTIGPALPIATEVSQLAVDAHHDAWAAGTRGTAAAIARWHGHHWADVTLPAPVAGATTSGIGIATTRSGHTTWAFANTTAPVILRAR